MNSENESLPVYPSLPLLAPMTHGHGAKRKKCLERCKQTLVSSDKIRVVDTNSHVCGKIIEPPSTATNSPIFNSAPVRGSTAHGVAFHSFQDHEEAAAERVVPGS